MADSLKLSFGFNYDFIWSESDRKFIFYALSFISIKLFFFTYLHIYSSYFIDFELSTFEELKDEADETLEVLLAPITDEDVGSYSFMITEDLIAESWPLSFYFGL